MMAVVAKIAHSFTTRPEWRKVLVVTLATEKDRDVKELNAAINGSGEEEGSEGLTHQNECRSRWRESG